MHVKISFSLLERCVQGGGRIKQTRAGGSGPSRKATPPQPSMSLFSWEEVGAGIPLHLGYELRRFMCGV